VNILSVLRKDGYKVGHPFQYPDKTTMVYSNLTPRSSRVEGVDQVVVFGPQFFAKKWLIDDFNRNFFDVPRAEMLTTYKRRIENYLGPLKSYNHIEELHELGYLPLKIKALPEGTLCPLRVPLLTIRNTLPRFGWLTNMLETHMSAALWRPITSATTSFNYRREFEKYAKLTGGDKAFVKWQGHDFSMRGIDPEASISSGAAHLLSFTGTDTIPAIDFLEQYYGADCEKELIGGSVPATEHSVMSMGMQDGEFNTIRRLITEVYPTGIVSIVCDTWDFWKVLTDYLPRLKNEIMARDGKVVVRPDSGDPVDIICGARSQVKLPITARNEAVWSGAIGTLWHVFGGTVSATGHKILDPHIGLIYGDSITKDRQEKILSKLMENGFASTNVVLGIGSYTFQYVTRDTYGLAVKATYGEIDGKGQAIFKKPLTDDGLKNSAKGLLRVERDSWGKLVCHEDQTWEQEEQGLLQDIFVDGETRNFQTLSQIRERIEAQL